MSDQDAFVLVPIIPANVITALARSFVPQLVLRSVCARHSVVGVEFVGTLRARVKNRRAFVSTACLSLAKLHLGVVALGTFFVGDLLRACDLLRDGKSGEAVAFALECGRVVGWTRRCACLVWPLV